MGKFVEYFDQKRPVWKPNKRDLLLVRKCAEKGLTVGTIVAKLREEDESDLDYPLTEKEFGRSVDCFPALKEAFESGRANGEIILAEKLWAKAMSDSAKEQFQAIKFLLEKRFNWNGPATVDQSAQTQATTQPQLPSGIKTELVEGQ